MPTFPYAQDLRGHIQNLTEKEQQELFALSCFDEGHWEDAPLWEVNYEEVRGQIRDYLETFYGSGKWTSIEQRGDVETILTKFSNGELSNEILAWYLEEKYPPYNCKTETRSDTREFDVLLRDGEIGLCAIGIKRLATTNQMYDYLREHRDKCRQIGSARKYLLANFYPTTTATKSARAADLVEGYGYLSAMTDEFYERENVFVVNIPAPIFPESEGIKPLDDVHTVLKTQLDITR